MNDIEKILKKGGYKFKKNSPVKNYVTISIGGTAQYVIIAEDTEELFNLLNIFHNANKEYIVLGGGSNTVFSDGILKFAVIINRSHNIEITSENLLKVNSGLTNISFLKFCVKNGISGFDFLSGIPGTIGGAVAVNAGAFGVSISDFISGGEIYNSDGIKEEVEKGYFEFEYRNSKFKLGRETLLNVYLTFERDDPAIIKERIDEIFKIRTSKHPPYSKHSAGCFFKNPVVNGKKLAAGKLIEEAELKGYEEGGIRISHHHSNFIINNGQSSFEEICRIEKMIIEKVKRKSGIRLDREVIFISKDGKKY